MPSEEKTKQAADLYDQAMKSFEQALKAALKLQEESARLWSRLASQAASPLDWQKRARTAAEELIPQTQKSLEEFIKVIEQNSALSIELMKKALAMPQSASLLEAQEKWLGFWEASLNAVRDGALSVMQANARGVESWIASARKSWDTAAGKA
jgi:hypothetical protein